MKTIEVALGLGSNLGDRHSNLEQAVKLLSESYSFSELSSLYESDPVDFLEQDCFLNQVAIIQVEKDLDPLQLLSFVQSIEKKMGRTKIIDKGPRNIDIDILFMEKKTFKNSQLIIPHPAISSRSFVCLPLLETKFAEKLKGFYQFPTKFPSKCARLEQD